MSAAAVENAARLFRAGKLNEAAELFAAVLASEPQNFDALHGLGVIHSRRGEFDTAERLFRDALVQRPSSPELLFNQGSLLQKLGRNTEALACFDAALAMRPGYAEALANRGAVLMDLGRHEDALADFTAVTQAKPALAQAWSNLGSALVRLARHREALATYSRAITINTESVEARRSRAWLYSVLKQYAEALADTGWLLARDAKDGSAWKLRADILAQSGRRELAVESYGRVLELQPENADALNNRAANLFALQRFEESARDYAALAALHPDYRYALGSAIFARRCCCDWDGLHELCAKIEPQLAAGKHPLQPFHSFICCDSPADIFRATRAFASTEYPAKQPLAPSLAYGHERIRVGYLSGNFHSHAVARLIAGVFEHHDRGRFDIQAFSFGPDDGGPLRQRMLSAFNDFIDVRTWDDERVAREIRTREVDILVDLMGFTENSRPGIAAWKPAPIQMNYLGYAGTTAADYMDYLIADPTVIPETDAPSYSEKIIRLPHCYLPADDRRATAPAPSRSDAGLPDKGFIFCCFNHSYKIAPEMFALWMRLLQQVTPAYLWLSNIDPAAKRNLVAAAHAKGIDTDRIIFAPFVPGDADHLARLSLADLFLDTNAYNAHATASDALWAGVPVLTICGETFPSRVGASLLRAIGLEELITRDLSTYEDVALSLARDPARLARIRQKLAQNRVTHPLFDTPAFTRNLESAYAMAMGRLRNGYAPQSFTIGNAA